MPPKQSGAPVGSLVSTTDSNDFRHQSHSVPLPTDSHDQVGANVKGSSTTNPENEYNSLSNQDPELGQSNQAPGTALSGSQEITEYDFSKLPSAHCAYCGIHSPTSLLRCKGCNKWFCNSRGLAKGATSHIVAHLVKSGHKEVLSHPESVLEGTALECFNCGAKNIFTLGFIYAKADNTMMILCRSPCLYTAAPKDGVWNVAGWQALVSDRSIQEWLVPIPPKSEELCARPMSLHAICKLEALWKTDPSAKFEDLVNDPKTKEGPAQACRRYEDGYHVQNTLAPLVQLEGEADRKLTDMQVYENLDVVFEKTGTSRHARFSFTQHEEVANRLTTGDGVILSSTGRSTTRLSNSTSSSSNSSSSISGSTNISSGGTTKSWEVIGTVIHVTYDNVVTVALKHPFTGLPDDIREATCRLQLIWSSVVYDRVQAALRSFAVDNTCVSDHVYSCLLGHTTNPPPLDITPPDDDQIQAPGLPTLNPSQIQAVKAALRQPLALIQGPPGTGKTVTSATLAYWLAKLTNSKILVCAPSNVVVDHLTERLHATGLQVVRVMAKSREKVSSSVDHLALHTLVNELATKLNSDYVRLRRLKAETGWLSDADEKQLMTELGKLEKLILSHAQIICCTCIGAGDLKRLGKLKFRHVLIDEATQATEPVCLVPIVQGAKQVILIGDHCQLGPTVISSEAADAGLKFSLFERLVMLGNVPHVLQVQYRMHPALSAFPSNTFYQGSLQNGVTNEDRVCSTLIVSKTKGEKPVFKWPQVSIPMYFHATVGVEELSASGTTYLNRSEASAVEQTITALIKSGVQPEQIGVITPYEGQRLHLISALPRIGELDARIYSRIEIASVDAYQGREKDYILFSCVRSNDRRDIGFLRDTRRLNVALTRGRLGLIIFGNLKTLVRHPLWHTLLLHLSVRGLLVEGPIGALRPAHVPLDRNKRYVSTGTFHLPVGFDADVAYGRVDAHEQETKATTEDESCDPTTNTKAGSANASLTTTNANGGHPSSSMNASPSSTPPSSGTYGVMYDRASKASETTTVRVGVSVGSDGRRPFDPLLVQVPRGITYSAPHMTLASNTTLSVASAALSVLGDHQFHYTTADSGPKSAFFATTNRTWNTNLDNA